MDFPIFHLDFLNNRFLIGIIAVLHVIINHPLAVGGIPLVTLIEWRGSKRKDEDTRKLWDKVALKILFVMFIITTTVGAMTGVGIWFSASLVNPAAIGSLIRVFFWGWFTEWIVFVTEVILILFYYLTWKKYAGADKQRHIRIGVILSLASWGTMAIIVAILGFMMDPGNWMQDKTLLSGFLNPLYLPQLAFRTPLAMVMGAMAGLFLLPFFTKDSPQLRKDMTATMSRWALAWVPALLAGALWYWSAVPESMIGNIPIANTTQQFADWSQVLVQSIFIVSGIVVLISIIGATRKVQLPALVSLVPFILTVGLLAHFERVREFIRKPYAIGEYLYSNGFRSEDYPLLQKEGILKHASYAKVKKITEENMLTAGKEVFVLACTRCHTVNGVNSITSNLQGMYGDKPWDPEQITQYIGIMHTTRGYMPPFPGNEAERDALAHYLKYLQKNSDTMPGAQSIGARLVD